MEVRQQVIGAFERDYTAYDANGNLTAFTDLRTAANNDAYGYDPLNRLVTAEGTGTYGSQAFGYDRNANRLSWLDNGATTTYDYAPGSNRLVREGTATVTLDANGNITAQGQRAYTHSPDNRLLSVIDNGTPTPTATYVYNALGQRVAKIIPNAATTLAGDADGSGTLDSADVVVLIDHILGNATAPGTPDCTNDGSVDVRDLVCLNTRIEAGETQLASETATRFIYGQNGELLAETDATGKVLREYIYLNGTPLAVLDSSGVHYLHTDHLDTPRAATDQTGTLVWTWISDPFGTTAANDDPDGDGQTFTLNLRFPGQYFDTETGLHYNYFRYYDPATGRYVTSDPIGLAGGLNTYGYVGGDPLSSIDLLGLRSTYGPSGTTLECDLVLLEARGLLSALGNIPRRYAAAAGRAFADAREECRNNNDCDDLGKQIEEMKQEIKRRRRQMLEDRDHLYEDSLNMPRTGRIPQHSWYGHQQIFYIDRARLKALIDQAIASGCNIDPEAEELLEQSAPSRPNRYRR